MSSLSRDIALACGHPEALATLHRDERMAWCPVCEKSVQVFAVSTRFDPLDGGWVAECPELPGCFSQGWTREEALSNLADAVAGVISLRVEGYPHAP